MNLRRQLLMLLASVPLFAGSPRAQTLPLKPTPQDALGPFYPPKWTGEIDNDLIAFAGKSFFKGAPLALNWLRKCTSPVRMPSAAGGLVLLKNEIV